MRKLASELEKVVRLRMLAAGTLLLLGSPALIFALYGEALTFLRSASGFPAR